MSYTLYGLWHDGFYRIEGPNFVVGFVVKDKVIVKAAPMSDARSLRSSRMVWKLGSHWINKAKRLTA